MHLSQDYFPKIVSKFRLSRDIGKLKYIENEIGATLFEGDVSDLKSVLNVFQSVDKISGSPGIVIFNPSVRIKGAIEKLCSEDVEKAFRQYNGSFYAQQAAIRMTRRQWKYFFYWSYGWD